MGNDFIDPGAKAIDSQGNELNVTIDDSGLHIYKLGSYTIIYRAKDAQGNEAVATRIINVVSPEILTKDLNVQKKACDNFASIKIGKYTYKNNTWGRDRVPSDQDWVQCAFSYLDANGTLKGGFYWGWPYGEGGVKGYPEAIYGHKFRQNLNPESGWPVKVSKLKEVFSHITYKDINFTGTYNIAPEWWLHLEKQTSMSNIKYEIMVRLDPKGVHPSHPWFANVNIEGILYDVYKDRPSGENQRQFFNFVVKSKIKDYILHPNAFMRFLLSKGVSDIPNLYYADVEMGVEVWKGSGLFLLDRFDVQQANKPLTFIAKGKEYSYSPDINDSSLRFTITNKPQWATFDPKSGRLSGTPDVAKLYKDIEIDATNGVQTLRVAKFDLNVTEVVEITHMHTKATQGSTYQNYDASLAIDGDINTYNHTLCESDTNWWQLELPDGAVVTKVSVKGRRDAHTSRIKDAKVYVSPVPYGPNLGKEDGVLRWTTAWQDIELPQPKPAKYVIVKAKDDNCLHLAEVKVYGSVPQAPIITSVEILRPKISPAINQNTTVAVVEAYDLQDDDLTYSITNHVPFSINDSGEVKVSGSLEYDTSYLIKVAVSDGNHTSDTNFTIQTTAMDALQKALQTGDASEVTIEDLYNAMDSVDVGDKQCLNRLHFFYPDGVPDNPYRGFADHFISTSVVNTPILGGYEENQNVYYGFIGEKRNKARYAMIGAPLQTLEPYTKPAIANLFKWLAKKEQSGNIFQENLRILVNANAKSDLQTWLQNNQIQTNWTITEDASLLDSGDFDIYIAQRETTQNYKKAIEKGKGVLLYDRPTWEQREYFNLQYTQWSDTQGRWTSFEDVCADVAKPRKKIVRLLDHLRDEDIDIVYTSDDPKEPTGYDRNTNLSLRELVFEPLKALRSELASVDLQNINIFDSNLSTDKFLKLALLIGDKYRPQIHYPMDKDTTDDATFYKAYFADSAILYSRPNNKTQPDLGNFSRSDFSHITPTTKVVHLISKKPFRAAGVYVLPGQKVTITRLDDNQSVIVRPFVNSIRPSSTHPFEKDGYKRPKYLQSNHIEIQPHQTISLTSPYGGTLQIEFEQNDANVSLEISNIGLHPFWSEFDADPDKDAKFEQALEANEYDWAELVTSAFEVHSKRDKMIESIQEVLKKYPYEGASGLAEATKLYVSSYPMALAGYKGPGIASFADVVRYATLKDIPIYDTDFVKHMNADQATCGYGCSGNPYDAFWAFDPVGFGDIHEVGHSLERPLFLLKGWEGHSRTNQYVYYSFIKYNQYIEHNDFSQNYYKIDHHIEKEVFKEQYNAIQHCVGSTDTLECMRDYWYNKEHNGSNYKGQSLFVIEAMMNAQKYAVGDYALDEGFHLLTRLHLLERYLQKDARKDWENNKAKIGLSNYSLDEINQLVNNPNDGLNANDWMLISLSWASGFDFRPYFDMFGQPYSQKASDQVASFGFPAIKKVYFAVDKDTGFILPQSLDPSGEYLDKRELPVDGHTSYDTNTSTSNPDSGD